MGDRANVYVKQAEVYLYTHWGGHDLAEDVRRALARQQRWDDESYLTRIIFCEMLRGSVSVVSSVISTLNDEAGYGISHKMGDNERPIIVVDCREEMVYLMDESDRPDHTLPYYKPIPFSKFICMDAAAVRKWHLGESEDDGEG